MDAVTVELVSTGVKRKRYYWRVSDVQTNHRIAVSDVFPDRAQAVESLELVGRQIRGAGITDAESSGWQRAAMIAQAALSIVIAASITGLLALLAFMIAGRLDFTELVALQIGALLLAGVGAVLSALPEEHGHRPLTRSRRPLRLWLTLGVGILVMTLAVLLLVDAAIGAPSS